MARVAAEQRFDTLLTDQNVGVYALTANLARMDRDNTPRLDLTKILYALHWVGDADWPESMKTGPHIMTSARFELALSRHMTDGSMEGSAQYEAARRAMEPFVEKIRHRFLEPRNWNSGTTEIVLVRDFKMVGRSIKREPFRLEYRFQFECVLDEAVS